MVTQVKAISSRTSDQMEVLFKERAAQMRAAVAVKIADAIVDLSPVDTGTYVMAHVAGPEGSNEAESRSSRGKPRGRSPSQFKNLARANLRRSVSAAAIQASNEIWFRNRALHAARVEWLGWDAPLFGNPDISGPEARHVYTKARAMVPKFIRDTARELGLTTR